MHILLVSDIHGNFPALQAIEEQVRTLACKHILNCGDTTVYAPFPNECLDWLRHHHAFSIRGNTDDKVIRLLKGKDFKKPSHPDKRIMYTSTAAALSQANTRMLLGLKKKKLLRLGKVSIGLFHGSPADHDEFLFADTPEKRFRQLAADTGCELVITGHSHSPYHREVKGVHFINPGSAGRMFDGNPEAAYAILTIKHGKIGLAAVECDLVEAARERWFLFPLTVAREKNRVFIQVAERGFLAAAGQRADAAAF